MKEILYKMVFASGLALISPVAFAHGDGIDVSRVVMVRSGDEIVLEMTLAIDRDAVTTLHGVAVYPTLSDPRGNRAYFPCVVVNGLNRSRIYRRHEKFGRSETDGNRPFRVVTADRRFAGEIVAYSAGVTAEEWMERAELSLVFVLYYPAGVRKSYSVPVSRDEIPETAAQQEPGAQSESTIEEFFATVDDRITSVAVQKEIAAPSPTPVYVPAPAPIPSPAVIATRAATATATAVHTISGTAKLDFEAASSVILPALKHNAEELEHVDETIRHIAAIPGASIVAVTITGYSSPDGFYDTNVAVSYDRAASFARYFRLEHSIPEAAIKIRAVGEDWSNFRTMVDDSSLPWREEALEIIDSADAPDAKESRLRRMASGRVWQGMEREIFPSLRKVDYSIDYVVTDTLN